MAIDKQNIQRVLKAIERLTTEEQQRLIEELTRKIEAAVPVTPLALSGTWVGVSLSAEEIDEARRQCWAGLGVRG